MLKASEMLLEDTLHGNEEAVAEGLDRAHTEVASILTYNDENSQFLANELLDKNLLVAVSLAYYSARKDYLTIREMPTGRGYADIIFLPLPFNKKPALVVELKVDKSVAVAIGQIKKRNYTQALESYSGEILLVGVNYDKNSKEHSCVIEKIVL